jgi:hypothetical protein
VRPGNEMSTNYFSCSGGPSAVFIKSAPGHNALNLCFSIRRDLWVTQCVLVHLGCETSAYYFSYIDGNGTDST